MQSLLGKIVKVKYLIPPKPGSIRYDLQNVGRVVKVTSDGAEVLVVNPQVTHEIEVTAGGIFKWGMWVKVKDAEFVPLPECSYCQDTGLHLSPDVVQPILVKCSSKACKVNG